MEKTPTQVVVVDSNMIVYRAWWLDTPEWTVLLQWAATGKIRLIVPDLVVVEVVARFQSTLVEQSLKAAGAVDSVRRMDPSIRQFRRPDDAAITHRYETFLRTTLERSVVEISPTSHVAVDRLVDRAARRVPPFDHQGNGFRDTCVWLVALSAGGTDLSLVSGDKAFGNESGLLPELKTEAMTAGWTQVSAHGSIRGYIEASGTDAHVALAEAVAAARRQARSVGAALTKAFEGESLPSADGTFTATIMAVAELHLEPTHATSSGPDAATALIRFEGSVRVQLNLRLATGAAGAAAIHTIDIDLPATATADFSLSTKRFGRFAGQLPYVEQEPTVVAWRTKLAAVVPPATTEILQTSNYEWPPVFSRINTSSLADQYGVVSDQLRLAGTSSFASIAQVGGALVTQPLASSSIGQVGGALVPRLLGTDAFEQVGQRIAAAVNFGTAFSPIGDPIRALSTSLLAGIDWPGTLGGLVGQAGSSIGSIYASASTTQAVEPNTPEDDRPPDAAGKA